MLTMHMTNCTYCGSFVTQAFVRVFGDNDDTVHRCPNCADMVEIEHGRSAGVTPQAAGAPWDGGTG